MSDKIFNPLTNRWVKKDGAVCRKLKDLYLKGEVKLRDQNVMALELCIAEEPEASKKNNVNDLTKKMQNTRIADKNNTIPVNDKYIARNNNTKNIDVNTLVEKYNGLSLVDQEFIDNLKNNMVEFKNIFTSPNANNKTLSRNDNQFFNILIDISLSLMINSKQNISITTAFYSDKKDEIYTLDIKNNGENLDVNVNNKFICKKNLFNQSTSETRDQIIGAIIDKTERIWPNQMYLVYENPESNTFTIKSNNANTQNFINDIITIRCNIALQLANKFLNPIRNTLDSRKIDNISIEDNTLEIDDIEIIFLKLGQHANDNVGPSSNKKTVQYTRSLTFPIGMSLLIFALPTYDVTVSLDYQLNVDVNIYNVELFYRKLKNRYTNTSSLLKLFDNSESQLNKALLEYLITGIPLDDERDAQFDVKKRTILLLDAYIRQIDIDNKNKCEWCDRQFIVYHGAANKLHATNDIFQCLTFLSTTLSWKVATDYAHGDDGYIYAIKIPVEFPFLHLEDSKTYQILLPIGCTIRVLGSINLNGFTIFQCECVNDYTKQKIELLKNEFQCVSVFPSLKPDVRSFARLSELGSVKSVNSLYATSVFHETVKNGQKYFIKSITKGSNSRRNDRGGNYILKRVINEVLATIVYNFYGLDTFYYDIVYNDTGNKKIDVFSLGNSFINDISYYLNFGDVTQAKQVMSGFLVDCIVSNWDIASINNIGFLNGKIIRTDVGGALAYYGIGDLNISFYGDTTCKEHESFLEGFEGIGTFYRIYLRTLEKNNIKLRDLAYPTLKNVNIDSIFSYPPILQLKQQIMDASIDNRYITFIDNILKRIVYRHNYYVTNNVQIGGKRLLRKKNNTRVYTVRKNKRNKIGPMHGGNDSSVNTKPIETPRDPEIFVSMTFFEEMMSKLSDSCQKNGGKKSRSQKKRN